MAFTLLNRFSPNGLSIRLLLGMVVAAANLFVVALVGYALFEGRQQQVARAEVQTQNLATMLQQGLSSRVRSIDLALQAVVDEHRRQVAAGGIHPQRLNQLLSQHLGRLPELEALRVTNSDGIILYGEGVRPADRVSLADRDYFLYQKQYGEGAFFLGSPVKSRVSGNMIVAISRRLEKPGGAFDGMVYATIRLAELTRIFSTLDLGKGGTVVLRDTSRRLIARYPEVSGEAGEIGNTRTSKEFSDLLASGRGAATYFTTRPSDGVPRLYAFERLPGIPWFIIIGVAEDTFLQEWRSQALRYSGFALFFLVISLLVSRMLWTSWQRQAETAREMEATRDIMQTVTNLASDWVYWRSPDRQQFYYLSPACEAVTGYGEATLRAHPDLLEAMIHPDDRARWEAHLDSAEGHDADEYRIVTPNGQVRWLSHTCNPVHLPDGRFGGRRGAFLNITERKQAEAEVLRSQRRLETIFRASPVGICISGLNDGRFVEVNAAFCQMYGYTRAQCLGTTSLALGLWVDAAQRDLVIDQITHQGSARDFEIRQRCADGRILDVLISGEVIELGHERLLLSIHVDITRRKQDEEALRAAKEAADAASRAKSQFLAVMSHELRTPMNGMLGMAQLLMGNGLSEGERKDYARTLYQSGQSLLSVLNDILDHSKIEAGRLSLVREAFDPATLVAEMCALFQGTATQKGLALRSDNALPPGQTYWGDPHRIRQMLSNLVSNALKFTEQGQVTVSVSEQGAPAQLVFTVTDTGVGIAPEKHGALFQAFSQVDDSFSRRHEGTGLGLVITRSLARLMGGEVDFDSAPGQGATFHIRLPAERAKAISAPSEGRPSQDALSQAFAQDPARVTEDIAAYCSESPALLDHLRTALAQGNLEPAQSAAASLKARAEKLYATTVVEKLARLVAASDLSSAQALWPNLQDALKRLDENLYQIGES